jgi:DnaJ-class molecular chaperone
MISKQMDKRVQLEAEKKFCHACGGWGKALLFAPPAPVQERICPVCHGLGVVVVLVPEEELSVAE